MSIYIYIYLCVCGWIDDYSSCKRCAIGKWSLS